MEDCESDDEDVDAAIDRIIRDNGLTLEQAATIRRAARNDDGLPYLCENCGKRLAVLAIDRDISMLSYDANGGLIEEIVDGEAESKLCRRCAGRDARHVPFAPWEQNPKHSD
jgi:hypothetical protein